MKTFLSLITAGIFSTPLFAQTTDTTAVVTDNVPLKSTFTLGTVYSNNANYYGQRSQESMPYAAFSATYRHKSGVYFSGMAYRLLNDSGSMLSASSLSAGVDFSISTHLSADISYSHTFYPNGSPFLQAANANNAGASLKLENWLSTSVSAEYAFGKTRDVFITLGTSKFINLGKFLSKKDFVSITPGVDVTGGTQRFYQTYVTEKRLKDSLLGLPLPPLLGGDSGTSTTETTTTSSSSFDLLSYNFKLPLAYNRSSYLLELAYQLSVLGNKVDRRPGKTNSFFTVSFYYQF